MQRDEHCAREPLAELLFSVRAFFMRNTCVSDKQVILEYLDKEATKNFDLEF